MTQPDGQLEAERNRLLRRADWRFLLPNPMPSRSICFTDGLLAQAVQHISRWAPDDNATPSETCDLAVAVDPNRATLAAAARALQPGGMFYSEWYAPWSGGAQGVRRQLETAGFEDIVCYWPWPWPTRAPALFWLPLEAPAALGYFMAGRPRPRAYLLRLAHAVRGALWWLAHRSGLTLPICATARKPARTAGQTLPVDVLASIRAGWEQWGLGSLPDHLDLLLLTGGLRSINKPVLLVFADNERRPRLAVKMSRVPEAIPSLAREVAVLQAVQALRPGGMQGVPQVLFSQVEPGLYIGGQTALNGTPMSTAVSHANYRHLAIKATDWLSQLAGSPRWCPRAAWWDRLVEPVLADFSTAFGRVVEPGLLQATRHCLATLDSLPLVCEQRDFSPWNVLIDAQGELVVLDWESAELQGLPLLDLIYFLAYVTFFLDGAMASGRTRASYRASLNPSTFTGRVRAECLAHYCHQLGLDTAVMRPLCLITWLLHARSEYQRLVADAGGLPTEATLRRSLFVSLWEEELRHMAVS